MWTNKATVALSGGLLAQALGVVMRSYALAAMGTVLIVWVTVAYVTRRSGGFEGTHEISNDRAFEGDRIQVKSALKPKGLPFGWAEVRDPLPASVDLQAGTNYRIVPMRRRNATLDYTVKMPVRGLYGFGPVESRNTGIFAMFEDRRQSGEHEGLLVMPRGEELSEMPLKSLYPMQYLGEHSVRSPGIGSNFYALRDYTPADEMRMVNWKATARSGKLVVNQWERETLAEATIFIDARAAAGIGTVGNNPLVRCARAASSITELLLKNKNLVRLVVYGKDVKHLHAGGGEQQLYKVLAELAEATPEGHLPFSEALDRTLHFLKPRTPVWIFTGLVDDPNIAQGVATLSAERNPVYVVAPDIIECMEEAQASGANITEEEFMEREGERQLAIQSVRGLGAFVVEWKKDDRLSLSLHMAEASH